MIVVEIAEVSCNAPIAMSEIVDIHAMGKEGHVKIVVVC
jgi:hypothetical protein